MRLIVATVAAIALAGCTDQSPGTEAPGSGSGASPAEFEGLATRLLWSPVETLGYEIYSCTSTKIFQVDIVYDEGAHTVTFPKACAFPVEATGTTLAAHNQNCAFPPDSGLPNEELRSREVNDFRYSSSSTRFLFSTMGERRIVEGEYATVYELLQGVLGDGDHLLKYPSGTTGYEYSGAKLYTFQPKALDDESGCSEQVQFGSDYADGIVFQESAGDVVLPGWGCSSNLQGIAESPVLCDYVVELPAAVPRLWLTQLELGEAGFLMKGELRGSDYKYCVELEAQTITKL